MFPRIRSSRKPDFRSAQDSGYGAIIKAGTDELRAPVDEFHFVGIYGDGRHKRYFILNWAVEKRGWQPLPRCRNWQAGIFEFYLDKFTENSKQNALPALRGFQLLRSRDQTL